MFRKILIGLVIFIVGIVGWRVYEFTRNKTPSTTNQAGTNQSSQSFDKTQHSTDQPGSIWWIVNKNRPLPSGYVPDDLTHPNIPSRSSSGDESQVSQKIVPALEGMVNAASADGINLMLVSGYRSYGLQVSVYNQNVRSLGQTEADKVSAHPGTSEHQTGLALDIGTTSRQCEIETCFGQTPEGQWIAANAYKYGFVIRYPEGQEASTGYAYEPWHLRYVGTELAAEIHKTGQTLEEFFGL